MKLYAIKSLNNQVVFFLGIQMSVNRQYIDSFNDVSDNGLFQLSGETSCLFKTSIWQATKTSMLPTALDFPKEISHQSGLALEI